MGQVLEKHNITLTKQKSWTLQCIYTNYCLWKYIAINLCLKIINCRKWLIISNIYALKQCIAWTTLWCHLYLWLYIFIECSAQHHCIVLYCIVAGYHLCQWGCVVNVVTPYLLLSAYLNPKLYKYPACPHIPAYLSHTLTFQIQPSLHSLEYIKGIKYQKIGGQVVVCSRTRQTKILI